jgi:hypothetical protein
MNWMTNPRLSKLILSRRFVDFQALTKTKTADFEAYPFKYL